MNFVLIKKHHGQGGASFQHWKGNSQVIVTWTIFHLVHFQVICNFFPPFRSETVTVSKKKKRIEIKINISIFTKSAPFIFCNDVKTTMNHWQFLDNFAMGNMKIQFKSRYTSGAQQGAHTHRPP